MNKPPYRVPLVSEINAIPWNGFTVASTFSGCGGSCLGYRMAGFKVVWANEFVPAAQDSYRANMAEGCILDGRDIKTVQPDEILKAAKIKRGDLDLFDGSPPCQAFSTAGKREKGWGKEKKYEHGAHQCNETLFAEYIRLLRGLQPKVFVAENVSGLLKGTAKGMFIEIMNDLRACGYRVSCRLLDAQWLGVPQQRQRAIFIGVREDLKLDPVHPVPLTYQYTVRDAIPEITEVVQDPKGKFAVQKNDGSAPCFNSKAGSASHVKVQATGPLLVKVFHEQGGFATTECLDRVSPAILATQCRMKVETDTNIDRYAIGDEWDKIGPGEQSKKYFSLVKPALGRPEPAVLASHGGASIAGIVHPTEKRKFTIAEVKRICAFPDDFVLTGSYAQQWERLGNSVPPVMMFHIASAIRDGILKKIKKRK